MHWVLTGRVVVLSAVYVILVASFDGLHVCLFWLFYDVVEVDVWEVVPGGWNEPLHIAPICHGLCPGRESRSVAGGEGEPKQSQNDVGVEGQYKEFSTLQRGFGSYWWTGVCGAREPSRVAV